MFGSSMLRTSNPALSVRAMREGGVVGTDRMTIKGVVNKSLISGALLLASAGWIWGRVSVAAQTGMAGQSPVQSITGLIILGAIGGLIACLVTVFKKEWSGYSVPVYALMEGLVLGGVSAMFERQYPGIVVQAVALTMGAFFVMLGVYRSGLIQVTDKFRAGMTTAIGAVCLVYMVSMIVGMFGVQLPIVHSTSLPGIGFSLIVAGIAAFSLLLDFDLIEKAAGMGVPRYMEWYSAFALMVTLIWLYLEILRLLLKLRSRD